MWIIAKALHVSPFSQEISNLSPAQHTWILTNHFKDQEEEFENTTKVICRFVNPIAASNIWDKKDVEMTVSSKDVLFEQMSKDLKGKYSPEELEAIMQDPKHYASLDVIEKVK